MFEHHATYVLLDLALLCHKAARRGKIKESMKISKLSAEIEKLFPAADAELHARFPGGDVPDKEG